MAQKSSAMHIAIYYFSEDDFFKVGASSPDVVTYRTCVKPPFKCKVQLLEPDVEVA